MITREELTAKAIANIDKYVGRQDFIYFVGYWLIISGAISLYVNFREQRILEIHNIVHLISMAIGFILIAMKKG